MKTIIRLLGFHPDCAPKTSDWLALLACIGAMIALGAFLSIISIIGKG